MRGWLRFAALAALLVGCASSDRNRAWVNAALRSRHVTRAPLSATQLPRALARLNHDGLDEDSAIAIALANNPAYQADLARIDSARADLDEAGRPVNPQLTLLGAIGPVSAMATLLAPLESLWQLPKRSEMAARTLESIAESLVQSGLDLARDTKLALANRVLAEDRLRIRRELAAVWRQLSALTQQHVEIGEAAPSEGLSLRAEATLAEDLLEASQGDLQIARSQLRNLLGLEPAAADFAVRFARPPVEPPMLSLLMATARRSRPDVRAAELSLLAAGARAGWEQSKVVAVAAQLEGHWTRPDTFASRLGGRIELPIFGANPGGRGRAAAELQRTAAGLSALRQRVQLEVVQAQVGASQSRASLARYRESVLPVLDEARVAATQNYALGEESYVAVLNVMRRSGEARLREAELIAQGRRSAAELERAVGARIGVAR